MKSNKLIEAAACLDDLASGTLSLEDTLRERAAARGHVERLYRLADRIGDYPELVEVLSEHVPIGFGCGVLE